MVLDVLAAGVHREQRQLGAVFGPLVHHIEPKVEVLGHLQPFVLVGPLVIRHVGGDVFHKPFPVMIDAGLFYTLRWAWERLPSQVAWV